MSDSASYRYAKKLYFRAIDAVADAKTVIEFGRDLYLESLGSDAAFRRDYGQKGERFLSWLAVCGAAGPGFAALLEEEGDAIGLVAMGEDARNAMLGHVHHFYIRRTHRGQGFGGLLDDYARETLRRAGFRRARLNVTARNKRAIRFYTAQGWEMLPGAGALRHMEVAL